MIIEYSLTELSKVQRMASAQEVIFRQPTQEEVIEKREYFSI